MPVYSIIEPRMVPGRGGGYIPATKRDAARWLAMHSIDNELGIYENPTEAVLRDFQERHEMGYKRSVSKSKLYDRLTNKLMKMGKAQLYRTFFTERKASRRPRRMDLTEIGPVQWEQEQMLLFPDA